MDSHAARKFQIMKYFKYIESQLIVPSDVATKTKAKTAKELMENFSLNYGNISSDVTQGLKGILINYIGPESLIDGVPNIEKILENKKLNKKSADITIDDLEKALEFVFSEEEVLGNRQARSYSEGLVTQLHNLNDKYGKNLFNIKKTGSKSINNILNAKGGISIIDVSQIVDDDGLKLFSNYVARYLFKTNRTNAFRKDSPIYLILDEAHRYIKEGMITDDSIFNRIAREGRKFGIKLTVISQIPSELSRVVLSQTSTFIIHRIQNSLDLEYIRKNVPAISSDQVNRLPYFAPGMAVILGSSKKIPMEMIIDGTYKNDTSPISMRTDE